MDAQELRNLQEAYMEVVENQQLDEEEQSSMPPRRSAAERNRRAKELGDRQTIRKIVSGHNKGRQPSRQEDPEKYYPKEQVDIYDIILSHLLDEGYAETPEAAEAIMVSMSEEWRESIVDEVLDEAVLGARKGHIRSVIAKGGGPGSIKYVASGGDIVANDRAAQERASASERTRTGKNKVRTAQFQQANKKSIERLNSKPGEDSGDYDSGYHGDDDTSNGNRHYSLSHTNRAARRRRETGR